jgi:outer membrane protein OmpA-like peptidoglycan-associated protein
MFRAFVFSLLFHLALVVFFRITKLERFAPATERLVPRAFSIPRLNVNPELIQENEGEEEPSPKKTADSPQIEIPLDKPSAEQTLEEMRATPLAPPAELAKPIVSEAPRVDSTSLQTMARMQESASKSLDRELSAATSQILKDRPKSSAQSLLKMAEETQSGAAARSGRNGAGAVSGFSNLDNLLGQAGGVKPGDAPVSMPGGALFEFNSAQLGPEAIELLRKLGTLIKRSPKVIFSIEGHTDAFGTDEENQALSLARAEAVRQWLIQNMNIDPAKVQTRGFGSSRLLVQPKPYDSESQASIDAEKHRQQPNRRVEIVFRFVR